VFELEWPVISSVTAGMIAGPIQGTRAQARARHVRPGTSIGKSASAMDAKAEASMPSGRMSGARMARKISSFRRAFDRSSPWPSHHSEATRAVRAMAQASGMASMPLAANQAKGPKSAVMAATAQAVALPVRRVESR